MNSRTKSSTHRTRENCFGLLLPSQTTSVLLGRLVEPALHTKFPILAKMHIWQNIVMLHHFSERSSEFQQKTITNTILPVRVKREEEKEEKRKKRCYLTSYVSQNEQNHPFTYQK
jgi:hypothetical protein